MKHTASLRILIIWMIIVLCLQSVCFMTGCGKKLQETADGVQIGQDEVLFHHASVVYEPVKLGKKYGSLKITKNTSLKVFTIEGLSPDEWLSTEDGDILYADGVKLPTLSEMNPYAVQVCAYQASIQVLRRINSAETVASLVERWENGENVPYMNQTPLRSFKLRFQSEVYPAVYYSVLYLEYAGDIVLDGQNRGRYFLYSAFDGRFVSVGSELHDLFGFTDDTTAGNAE